MDPESDQPAGDEAEERAALAGLRAGIARVRRVVREARQALGKAPPEGAVLGEEPAGEPAAPPPAPTPGRER